MVDHFLNNSVVDRLVLLAVVDIVVPEMAFVGRVVGSLGCAFCGDLVVGDNLGPCVGQTDGGHCPKSSLMSCVFVVVVCHVDVHRSFPPTRI